MAIASLLNFSYAGSGQRVATVKSTPFAVPEYELEGNADHRQRKRTNIAGPAHPRAGRGYPRLDRIGTSASFVLSSVEEEGAVARSLQHLLRANQPLC